MNKQIKTLIFVGMILLLASACGQFNPAPAPVVTQEPVQTEPVVNESPTEPVMVPVTEEIVPPAGWATTSHAVQTCAYQISFPADMQVSEQGANSRLIRFALTDPDGVARNFVYVSIITEELRNADAGDVYNYSPMATNLLFGLQLGESASLHDNADIAPWFTFQRLHDATISGQTALAFENIQPWEFPVGTKELRYHITINDCMYQIGGYMDTTGSNQPGMITEDLFHQIMDQFHIQ